MKLITHYYVEREILEHTSKFCGEKRVIFQRNQRYLEGHVTGSEIFQTPEIVFKTGLKHLLENVESEPNHIMSTKLYRKRTVLEENFTFAFGAIVDDLGSSSNMAARKQNIRNSCSQINFMNDM